MSQPMAVKLGSGKLSKKQKKVYDLLQKGKTPKEVASKMGISVNGVYGHMRRIENAGFEVPRSGRGGSSGRTETPAPAASPNGGGAVSQVDIGVEALVKTIEDRIGSIKEEADEISDEREKLDVRTEELTKECKELETRHKALASIH
jgi:hypothetical protein